MYFMAGPLMSSVKSRAFYLFPARSFGKRPWSFGKRPWNFRKAPWNFGKGSCNFLKARALGATKYGRQWCVNRVLTGVNSAKLCEQIAKQCEKGDNMREQGANMCEQGANMREHAAKRCEYVEQV
jgi:hypothetical protein